MLTPEQIARVPKVLLHDHLDGGVRPETVAAIAERTGHELPVSDPAALGEWFAAAATSGSLVRYLETFEHTVGVMQTTEDLVQVARECVEDLADDGVVYAEVRWAPEQHLREGLSLTAAVDAVREGFAQGTAEAARRGRTIHARQILTAMRHQARSLEIAELAVAYRDRGVVGFDIAGAEAGYPPTRHLDAFEYLHRENAHFTIHAGEAFGLPSIWQAIQWCGTDRLGHGVRIIDDIDLTDPDDPKLGRLAAYVRQADPVGAVPVVERADGCGAVDRRAPDRDADVARFPGHREHRQQAHESDVHDPGDVTARGRVPLRSRRPPVVHGERDEERVPPLRPAARAHPRCDQAGLCYIALSGLCYLVRSRV